MEKDTGAELAARLDRLEAERDVLNRLHEACVTVDGPSAEAWLDCFTRDGAFSWAPSEGAARELDLNGRAELAAWFAQHRVTNPVGSQMHVLLHPVIAIEAEVAAATTSYMTLRMGADGLFVASAGVYADRLRREADGRWRMSEHRATGARSTGERQASRRTSVALTDTASAPP